MLFNSFCCLASVAGAVIQATGRTELEDGLCAGGQLKARNGLQRVGTILWINRIPPRGRCETQTSRGQTQFESAEASNKYNTTVFVVIFDFEMGVLGFY